MQPGAALCAVVLCALNVGCGLATNFTRVLVFETAQTVDDKLACIHHRRAADAAWDDARRADPQQTHTEDYARGFKVGFADYLYADGTTAPPPVPPRRYWKTHYQTPQGHRAIEDWYAGYAQGATAARESNGRQWITVPSSLAPLDFSPAYTTSAAPAPSAGPQHEPILHSPREVPPELPDKEVGRPPPAGVPLPPAP